MSTQRPNLIDRAAALSTHGAAYRARCYRPEFVSGAEACRSSVFTPQDDLGLPRGLRLALAMRSARLHRNEALSLEYAKLRDPTVLDAQEERVAAGVSPEMLTGKIAAMARHADLIALNPKSAEATHLTALKEAGLSDPQIVALSELLAFVSFEVRLVEGLQLLDMVS